MICYESESLRWLGLLEKSLNRDLSVQHHHLMFFLVLLTINKKIAVKYIPLHASHTQAKFAVRNNWNWTTAPGTGVRTRMNESSTYHKKRVKVESKKLYHIDHKGFRDFLKSHLKFNLGKPFRSFCHNSLAFAFVYNKPNFMGATWTLAHGFIRPCLLQNVFEKYRFSSTNFLVKPFGEYRSKKNRLQKGFGPIFLVTKYELQSN